MKNELWAVYPDQSEYTLTFNHLWVVANTIESAISKAKIWLKKNGHPVVIDKVESHGTVDVL